MIPTREELERLRELAGKATPGPWCIESLGEKGDGSNIVGVAYGPDDEECERPLTGWVRDYDDNGDEVGIYRDEEVCACEHRNRNSNCDAAYIAAAHPAMIAHLLACHDALWELVECKRLEDNYANGRHDYKLAHDDCQNCADGRESDSRTPPAWSAARALIGGSHE